MAATSTAGTTTTRRRANATNRGGKAVRGEKATRVAKASGKALTPEQSARQERDRLSAGMRERRKARKSITQAHYVAWLSQEMGWSKSQVRDFLDAERRLIAEEIGRVGIAQIPGVCRFRMVRRAATKSRMGRNPATGEEMTIPARPRRKAIRMTPVKALNESILNPRGREGD